MTDEPHPGETKQEFMISQMYWQTCDPRNSDCLVKQMAELKANYKISIGISMFIGAAITAIANAARGAHW